MKARISTILSLGFLTLAFLWGDLPHAHSRMPGEEPKSIISLAPSATEILFALGLGRRVVGATRFCDYPESAKAITRIGGFFNPNYELIVALRPGLVVLLTSHRDARRELEKMGIRTLTIPHRTIDDIHEAIGLIGEVCGAQNRATALVQDLKDRTAAVHRVVAVEGAHRPRVLVCIGRDTGSGQLAGIYVAGRNGFFDELIELAGGINAYQDEKVAYPQLSAEGVIWINPEVIVDLVGHIRPNVRTPKDIEQQWDQLHPVAAVGTGRIHAVAGTHALRPGPRYIRFLEQLARLLHPRAFAKKGHQ